MTNTLTKGSEGVLAKQVSISSDDDFSWQQVCSNDDHDPHGDGNHVTVLSDEIKLIFYH